ncbi:MAG: ABC transporter permease [Candidatus Eisenbacteria sp.]|nr:ABC transporter permease [Candidatus Eisenbacteria bacterium]
MAVRIGIAIVLFVHGLAHLVGFVVPWRIATLKDAPYKTTLLSGAVDVGDVGIRLVGILWLAAAVAFVAAGVGIIAPFPWWRWLALCTAGFSLVLSILGWPDSKIGVPVNVAILAFLIAGFPQ